MVLKSATTRDHENFAYRLRRRLLTESMENILRALDTWMENSSSAATCQQIADLAGVHQTYIQRIVRALEAEGYVRLWKRRNGRLIYPGIFVLRGYKSLEENHEQS